MDSEQQSNSDEPVSPPESLQADEVTTPESTDTPEYVETSVPETADTTVSDFPQPEPVVAKPMPAENEPQPQPVSGIALPPKKSKKKLFVILAIVVSVLIALLGSAWATYALWYNNPDNAVADAFSKALSATSSSVTGTAVIKSDDSTVKANLSYAANESRQMSADVELTISASDEDYKLNGHFAGTQDEFYVKVDDLRSVLEKIVGAEYSAAIDEYYGGLLDKIDSKWVVIKQSDIESVSNDAVSNKESQCFEDELGKLQNDASVRNELVEVYKKNPLFSVESKGSDSSGNRYSLIPVGNDKAKAFAVAVTETKFFKALDDCTGDDLKKSFTDSIESDASSSDTDTTGNLEIWIDGWSHSINKVSLNMKSDSNEFTSEFTTKFNNKPSVTIPKGETTFDDLKTEIESLTSQLYDTGSDSIDTSSYY